MTAMKRFFFLSIIALLGVSCNMQPIEIGKVESTKIISLNQKGIEVELGVKIKNPNGFGFKIYESDLNVTVNGTPMGKAELKNNVKIKANSDEVHLFTIKSNFSNLLSGGLGALFTLSQSKSLDVAVKGEIKAGNFFMKKKYPVDLKQTISMNK